MKPTQIQNVSQLLAYYMHHYVEAHCIDYDRQKYACKALNLYLADLAVKRLEASTVKSYCENRRMRGKMVSDSTIRRELVVLISALNYAVDQRIIDEKDFPKIELPPGAPAKDLWLEEEELDGFVALAATFDKGRMSRIHRFVAIIAETASRKTAVQKLKWSQVNFSANIIEFDRDGTIQKNKKRVKVPISEALLPLLKRAFAERLEGCEYVLDSPFSIQHQWDKLRDLACEQLGKKFREVTPHSLRHTVATLMAKNGIDLRKISGVLGCSEATVEKVYAHHSPEYLKDAINYRAKKA